MVAVTVGRAGFLARVGAVLAVLLAQGSCGIPVLVGSLLSLWESRYGPRTHMAALWIICSVVPTGALGLVIMRATLARHAPGLARISGVVVASATLCGFWLAASNEPPEAVPEPLWALVVAFVCGFVATWWEWRFATAVVGLAPWRAGRDIGHSSLAGVVRDLCEPHEEPGSNGPQGQGAGPRRVD
jgi:hypothetical protein